MSNTLINEENTVTIDYMEWWITECYDYSHWKLHNETLPTRQIDYEAFSIVIGNNCVLVHIRSPQFDKHAQDLSLVFVRGAYEYNTSSSLPL